MCFDRLTAHLQTAGLYLCDGDAINRHGHARPAGKNGLARAVQFGQNTLAGLDQVLADLVRSK